jgi:hypothetical protein
VNILIRPLSRETQERVPQGIRRESAQFKSTEKQTMDLLEREIASLGPVKDADPVLQVDVDTSALLLRGGLRSSARPTTPTVALTVQTAKRGTLTFIASRYTRYEDNLRAIALTLEALRAVNRWGATESDEQYRGFEALPPASGFSTLEDAAWFIIDSAGWDHDDSIDPVMVLRMKPTMESAYRAASKRLHPDTDAGSDEGFKKLTAAREMLEGSAK